MVGKNEPRKKRRRRWKRKRRPTKPAPKSPGSWKRSRSRNSRSTAFAGCTEMAAAGIRLHPACRVRQEGFGLLFYDSRGPRLLFAETGRLLPTDFFATVRSLE